MLTLSKYSNQVKRSLLLLSFNLLSFTTDFTSKLNVQGLDSNTLGMNARKIGIFKETDHVLFSGFLESIDRSRLEAKVVLEVLGDFTNQTLEGQLADQEFSRLLILANLTESNGSGLVTMGLLETTTGLGGRLACSLGSELLTGSLASS
jgi:hypothetical protein